MCNGKSVVFDYKVNIVKQEISLFILGEEMDVAKLGLCPQVIIDQIWADSNVRITQHMRLCKGLDGSFPSDSSVPVKRVWNTITGLECDAKNRTHSHRCQILIAFNSPHSNETCSIFKQHFHLALSYKRKKMKWK